MIIKKRINIPIYRTDMLVIFTDDMQKVVDKYAICIDDNVEYEAITINTGSPIIIFNLTLSMEVLSHEIFHAVDMILSSHGIYLIKGTEESYAYLIGYVTQSIYDFINKNLIIVLK